MITCSHSWRAVSFVAVLLVVTACDSGSPSRSPDEIAADSALAADLALANRDTLMVDSIGEYRPVDAAERDADLDTALAVPSVRAPAKAAKTAEEKPSFAGVTSGASSIDIAKPPAARASARPVGPSPSGPVASTSMPSTSAESPNTPPRASTPTSTPAPRLITGPRACNSPLPANQSECVRVTLAATDMRLNRVYRALITETKRQEGVPLDGKDPPSVQRLRVAQRAWLVYRDTECRRRGRDREGALWARPRVRCLGQFSVRRANELADAFSKITAH